MNVTLKAKKTLPELTAFALYCDFLIIETFLKISLTSFSEIGLDRKMLNTVDHAILYIEIHIWQGRNYYRFFVRGWGRGGGIFANRPRISVKRQVFLVLIRTSACEGLIQ